MIFAPLPLDDCLGAMLAHSQRVGPEMFRKGRILTAADIAALRTKPLVSERCHQFMPKVGDDA